MPNQFRRIEFTWDMPRAVPMEPVHPGIIYWISRYQVANLEKVQHDAGRRLFHDRGPAQVPIWDGVKPGGRFHVAYYHDGAFGDELIHSAFQRQFALDYPTARLYSIVKSREPSQVIPGNRYAGERPFLWGPYIPEEAARQFDYWITPASVGYERRGSPENVYDLLADDTGITPDLKQPYIYIQSIARDQVRQYIPNACVNFQDAPLEKRVMPPGFWEKLIVVQLNASELERTPTRWRERLEAIIRFAGNRYYVAVVGDAEICDAIQHEGGAGLRIYAFLRGGAMSPTPFALLVLAEAASVIICPDSFMLHAGAAWNIPTVALWNFQPGAITMTGLRIPPPSARLATYPMATAIDKDGPPEETIEALERAVMDAATIRKDG